VDVWAFLALFLYGPTSENVVAIVIQHEHQIRPTELASLTQFDSKGVGLKYRKFRTRKPVSVLIGEHFRTIKDMEEAMLPGRSAQNRRVMYRRPRGC
jgi:hypothetical protein